MIAFTKLSAAGNDFIVLDGRRVSCASARAFAPQLCPRRTALGADGILWVLPAAAQAPAQVEHFEPNGDPTFCLNGLRGAAAWLLDTGLAPAEFILLSQDLRVPVQVSQQADDFEVAACLEPPRVLEERQLILPGGERVEGTYAWVGNPQFVVCLDRLEDLEDPALMELGARLRWHLEAFPEGANINFTAPLDATAPDAAAPDAAAPDAAAPDADPCAWRIRTYERGVEGETLACGTGMLAAGYALRRPGQRELVLHPRSGAACPLRFEGERKVWASGPVRIVADGQLRIAALREEAAAGAFATLHG